MPADRRPRLLVLSHNYLDPRYATKLDRLGERADVLLAQPTALPFMPNGQLPPSDRYAVVSLPVVFPTPVRTSTRWALVGLLAHLRAFQPDAILVENECSSFLTLQALIARDRFVPRATVTVAFWQNLPVVGLKRHLINRFSAWAVPRLDGFLAANADAAAIVAALGAPTDRVAVFPLAGADPEWFTPAPPRDAIRQQLGLAPDAFAVGFVGRLVEEKGLPDLVAALAALRDRGLPARGVIVGSGPLRDWLADQPGLIVVSPSSPQDVAPYYAALDALALPSRAVPEWKEQFGRVLIEAMLANVPVVGARSGAIPEVIGDDGWIVPERDPLALADALAEVAASPDRVACRVAAARARVLRDYTNVAIADRTLAFLERLPRRPAPWWDPDPPEG